MSRSHHSPKQRICNRSCCYCWPDGSHKLAKAAVDIDAEIVSYRRDQAMPENCRKSCCLECTHPDHSPIGKALGFVGSMVWECPACGYQTMLQEGSKMTLGAHGR